MDEKFFENPFKNDILKRECIDIFINELNKNNVFGKYMSMPEIEHKLNNIIKYVEYGETEYNVGGYWNHIEKFVRIKEGYDIKNNGLHILIHELIHALTDGEKRKCGMANEYGSGRALTEGATEWLTTKVLPNYANNNSYIKELKNVRFKTQGTYPFEQIGIKQLAILYGEDVVIEAMIKNDINKIIDKVEDNQDFWGYSFLFDHINETNSQMRYLKGNEKELDENDKLKISQAEDNICNDFLQAEEIFLDKFLLAEIKDAVRNNDINKLEELKVKLKELNDLGVNIKGEKEISYEKYNVLFIKEYLKIVNKDKAYNEKIKFDDVEKYILSNESSQLKENPNNFLGKINSIKNKLINQVKRFLPENLQTDNSFFAITRGNEKIYVRELGKEVIGGENICNYEYLTELQYEEYEKGDKEVKGDILKGNINFKLLKKDKEYQKIISEELLEPGRIRDKNLNYGGYIGEVRKIEGEYRKYVDSKVQERLEENIKVSPIGDGENTRYLVEMPSVREYSEARAEVNCYRYMESKEELEDYRNQMVKFESGEKVKVNTINTDPNTLLIEKIDMDRLRTDKEYNEFVSKEFLNEERIDRYTKEYQGYMGSVEEVGNGKFQKKINPVIREECTDIGMNGEKKVVTPYGSYYIGELGIEEVNGKSVNKYEIISFEKMVRMRMGDFSHNNDRIIVRGDIGEISQNDERSYKNMCTAITKCGGYIGEDEELSKEFKKNSMWIQPTEHTPGQYYFGGGYCIWKQENDYYMGEVCGFVDPLNDAIRVPGNIDIAKAYSEPEYMEFLNENLLNCSKLAEISSGKIKDFNIIEGENGYSLECKYTNERSSSMER